jgi:hypothetical protein
MTVLEAPVVSTSRRRRSTSQATRGSSISASAPGTHFHTYGSLTPYFKGLTKGADGDALRQRALSGQQGRRRAVAAAASRLP